jgi:hypothetical protein
MKLKVWTLPREWNYDEARHLARTLMGTYDIPEDQIELIQDKREKLEVTIKIITDRLTYEKVQIFVDGWHGAAAYWIRRFEKLSQDFEQKLTKTVEEKMKELEEKLCPKD